MRLGSVFTVVQGGSSVLGTREIPKCMPGHTNYYDRPMVMASNEYPLQRYYDPPKNLWLILPQSEIVN